MRSPLGRTRQWWRLAGAATILAASGAGAVILPSAASAGLLPTTTTVSVAPTASVSGQQVTITASVSFVGLPALGITPTGTVTFTASNGTAQSSVGSASLGFCLLSPCRASLTTSALPVGTTSITARYSGDAIADPSSGTAPASVSQNPNPGSSSTVNCYAGNPCDSGTVSADPSTSLEVVATASSGNQTVTASLDPNSTLHFCTAPSTGELANFSSTATDATKTVTYTVDGTAATNMDTAYNAHTAYLGCYASPNPFSGYTNGIYGPAPQVNEPGIGPVFEANLSSCANNSGTKPCFVYSRNGFPPPHSSITVRTNAGDPHLTGP